jgi:methionyl-tRNA synthetase
METLLQSLSTKEMLVLLAIFFWTIPWKAWGLWLAVKRNEIWWFLAMLLINTIGVLEIIYIFFIAKQSDKVGAREENS